MDSGFSGGGTPARSIASAPQPPYLSQNQFPGILPEPSPSLHPQLSQQQQPPARPLVRKRTLVDSQMQQQRQQHRQVQNQALNNLLLRYVKPRIHPQASPVSPLHSLDFPAAVLPSLPDLTPLGDFSSSRGPANHGFDGTALLQRMRSQPIGNGMVRPGNTVATALPGVPFPTALQNGTILQNVMINRLQELEKELLDDEEEATGGNATSVVTNSNSEWSDTLQSLLVTAGQVQKQISLSPTSSSSSSSPTSSLSVVSPATICLKQTILEAASAIYEGKSEVAAEILARLTALPNPKSNWEQKLMDYVLSALKLRLNPAENTPAMVELFSEEHVPSTQKLYDLSPCFKLGFMAANLVILEAALEPPATNKLHVVDFDIGQGGQYVNLLHALATRRSNRPSVLKITAVSDNGNNERLRLVGETLNKQAAEAGIGLHFRTVNCKPTDVNGETLGCEADEALVVNFAFKLYRMPDESVSEDNPRDVLLRRARALSPRVVTLVEQEWNANTTPFLTRVNEALGYYGTLLDSLESTVPKDHPDRAKVEEGLGRKLRNSISCEGRDRVERCEVFGKWRARMGMAGFVTKPMDSQVAESMRARLVSNGSRANPGFTVKEEAGGVGFGWHGRTLTVASAWRYSPIKTTT
ncbi:hypothetical protein MLD38_030384 [Melastoma candidum]|uniref:Uncharacterized protein n=1 Tax=Melastoma candidum TaxID=119954 RepID=A0ACB9ML10_9MYRT|nr:hypothetical protein MLD38_030384 [Melastoma candidum]